LFGQVSAAVQLHGTDAEMRIANPTPRPLSVTITLYRDATKSGGPVALGDSVSALISPSAFTLKPGAEQMVRLRVMAAMKPSEILRLATTFMPVEDYRPGMHIVLAVRVLTKVEAGP
jgi:hypothetical protein